MKVIKIICLTLFILPCSIWAQFQAEFNINSLNGNNGFKISGIEIVDQLGSMVSSAGDINGDGIDDLMVSAWGVDGDGENAGAVFVIFGNNSGIENNFDLSTLDGTNGFAIIGVNTNDLTGRSIDSIGDFNGDNLDDIAIGATLSDVNGINSGSVYIIFGRTTSFPASINLGNLEQPFGFSIHGDEDEAWLGTSAGHADLNNDGLNDIVIGAQFATVDGMVNAGKAYVIFGSSDFVNNSFKLSTLNGLNGFTILGEAELNRTGESVSSAGDINNDGIEDIVIGAIKGLNGSIRTGISYVIYGSNTFFNSNFKLNEIDGINGFRLNGYIDNGNSSGNLSYAGDVNHDGIDDMLIGASEAGTAHLIFGSDVPFPASFELSAVNGNDGILFFGADVSRLGIAVSDIGDINSDGIEDIALGADSNTIIDGRAYVIYGSKQKMPHPFNLTSLNGSNGFKIAGEITFGIAISSAVDINNDQISDVMIGASLSSVAGLERGAAYTIYGRKEIIFKNGFEPSD